MPHGPWRCTTLVSHMVRFLLESALAKGATLGTPTPAFGHPVRRPGYCAPIRCILKAAFPRFFSMQPVSCNLANPRKVITLSSIPCGLWPWKTSCRCTVSLRATKSSRTQADVEDTLFLHSFSGDAVVMKMPASLKMTIMTPRSVCNADDLSAFRTGRSLQCW